MKRIGLLFLLLVLAVTSFAQTKGYMKYDTLFVQKDGGNAELVIKNSTKGVTGGYLYNSSNGVTQFKLIGAGDIATGVLPFTRGGTGLGSLGLPLQVLRVNSAGTALEFGTPLNNYTSYLDYSGDMLTLGRNGLPTLITYLPFSQYSKLSDSSKFVWNQYTQKQNAKAWIRKFQTDSLFVNSKVFIGDTTGFTASDVPFSVVMNSPSQRNLFIGTPYFASSAMSSSDSMWYNYINVLDTLNTSYNIGEYTRPPRAGLYIGREQIVNQKNLWLEDGWAAFIRKSYTLKEDSAHLSPSTSDFVGGTKNVFGIVNGQGKKRVISSGDFLGDANAGFISSMNLNTLSGDTTKLNGYWAGITSYLYGHYQRDTIDQYTAFYSANGGLGATPWVKKYVHFGSMFYAGQVTADSLWFLKQNVGESGFNYLDGNLSLGGGRTGSIYKLDVSGITNLGGRVLVNNAIDNGIDAFQVGGNGLFQNRVYLKQKVGGTGSSLIFTDLSNNWVNEIYSQAGDGHFDISSYTNGAYVAINATNMSGLPVEVLRAKWDLVTINQNLQVNGKFTLSNVLNLAASTPPSSSSDSSGTDGDLRRDASGNIYLKVGSTWLKFTGVTF